MDDHERRETLQNMIAQFNNVSEENMRLLTKIEGLEHQIETQVSAIRGYKPFRNCNSIYDVFCLYDTLEGKLLAAKNFIDGVNDLAAWRGTKGK